jgi:ubiquinone biosynthesis protein COQ9
MDNIMARRDRILEAALWHVPFDGWTRRALDAGAADLGLGPSDVLRAFPEGVAQAVEYLSDLSDRRMALDVASRNVGNLPVHEIVALAVRSRLDWAGRHREAIRRVTAYFALPGHQVLATKCAYRTVDAIWRLAGDRSTDFNFYTKRALLVGVYGATVLYWLADESDGFEDTWLFLDRRIADVIGAIRARRRVTKTLAGVFSALRPPRAIFNR